ncbi:MAG: DUF4878 domain-containing protein [Aureispira sp.]|nr:DUF4878 domain-containing protein [Aureispira sp.]
MKRINQFLSIAILTLVFSACGGDTSTPEATLANFLNELQDMDFAGAKKYATDDTKAVLSTLESMMKMMPTDQMPKDEDKKTVTKENVKCKVDGDRARCVICMEGEVCSPETAAITVIKQGGSWLVNMSKEELSKDRLNKEDMSSAIDSGLDELEDELDTNLNIDSLTGEVTNMLDSLGGELMEAVDSLVNEHK